MKEALNGFTSIAAKELLHIRRDPTTLIFALLIPMIQMTLFGFAVDFDVRHVRTVVVDRDRSPESRTYVASLQNTQYLDVVGYLPTPGQALAALRSEKREEGVFLIEEEHMLGTPPAEAAPAAAEGAAHNPSPTVSQRGRGGGPSCEKSRRRPGCTVSRFSPSSQRRCCRAAPPLAQPPLP